jgi:hypothetical protein
LIEESPKVEKKKRRRKLQSVPEKRVMNLGVRKEFEHVGRWFPRCRRPLPQKKR